MGSNPIIGSIFKENLLKNHRFGLRVQITTASP